MHLGEGLLPAAHAAAWSAVATPALVLGLRRLRGSARVRAGLATALTFAVTLFPVPIPVVGMTSHMCATPLLALLYGPAQVVVPTALVLLLQALFFAHGGVTTLGANVVTLGIVGPWVAFGTFHLLRRARLGLVVAGAIACFIGDLAVYLADVGILGWALAASEPAAVWWRRLFLGLAPAQLPLAALEGLLSGWLVRALVRSGRWRLPDETGMDLPAANVVSGTTPALILLVLLASTMAPSCSQSFRGLDDSVFSDAGARAGRPSRSVFDWSDGEIGRALYGGAMLAAGVFLGRAWERSRRADPRRGDGAGAAASPPGGVRGKQGG